MAQSVRELFDLTGRVAVVTGATGYLGRAMATGLAEAGATVVVTSRGAQQAAALAAELPRPAKAEHLGVALDHYDEASLTAAIDRILTATNRIDVLVNNAHEPLGADLTSVTMAEFARQVSQAGGYFELARQVRNAAVTADRAASIIFLGSMYGQVGSYPQAYEGIGPANSVAYQALKGGIGQMTRHLAVYWAKDRIRVNCLAPGAFPPETAPRELIDRLEAHCPLGRIGRPEELKGAIVFLASDASSYLTGQTLTIDGGWTAW